MIWAALVLVAGVIGVSVFAWYFTQRMQAAGVAGAADQFARRVVWIPFALGVVIVAEGLVGAAITDDWLAVPPAVCVGSLTCAIGVLALRRIRRASGGGDRGGS